MKRVTAGQLDVLELLLNAHRQRIQLHGWEIMKATKRHGPTIYRALDRFSDGDAARAQALGRAWDNFDFQLTKHHEGEHEIAWPALVQVGVTQQMIDQMDAEHEVMAERLSAARASMAALRAAPTAANAQTAHTAMGELKTVTIEHLDHEERELEPVYQSKKDDPAVKEMGKKFSKVPPKEGGVFFAGGGGTLIRLYERPPLQTPAEHTVAAFLVNAKPPT